MGFFCGTLIGSSFLTIGSSFLIIGFGCGFGISIFGGVSFLGGGLGISGGKGAILISISGEASRGLGFGFGGSLT